jgi:hypothetical protein
MEAALDRERAPRGMRTTGLGRLFVVHRSIDEAMESRRRPVRV